MRKTICTKCGKEIKGGFYNAPSGVHCKECWEKKPEKERKKEVNQTLGYMASIGKRIK
jgi:DNA-directed RNA polymerase subunit RPC12/RpoP